MRLRHGPLTAPLTFLRAARPAALIVRFLIILALQCFGLKTVFQSRFVAVLLLLLFLLQFLAHRFGQIDFTWFLIFRHADHLLDIGKGVSLFYTFLNARTTGIMMKACFSRGQHCFSRLTRG